MVHDGEFEKILSSRPVPQARSNLEHRIVEESLRSVEGADKRAGSKLGSIFAAIFDNLLLPRPALSLALVLVLGTLIGIYSAGDGISDGDIEAYLLAANNIEYGEYL